MVKRRGHLWTFTDYDSVKFSATNNCPLSGLGERRREGHDAASESGCPCVDAQSHTDRGAYECSGFAAPAGYRARMVLGFGERQSLDGLQ